MQKILIALLSCCLLFACKPGNNNSNMENNKELAALFNKYYDERMQLFPLEATTNGDNRYNDQLPADFTDSYRARLKDFYTRYLNSLNEFERDHLNDNDKISYDILKYEMQMSLEGLSFHSLLSSAVADNDYIPLNQFWGIPLRLDKWATEQGFSLSKQ